MKMRRTPEHIFPLMLHGMALEQGYGVLFQTGDGVSAHIRDSNVNQERQTCLNMKASL